MELVGSIKVIFEEQRVSASFSKRELVLVTDERYPQQILVEFTRDKMAQLDNFAPGDEVRVQIDIRGREWTSPRGEVKYFTSIQGWRIDRLADMASSGPPMDGPPSGFDDIPPPDSPDGSDSMPTDDIPF